MYVDEKPQSENCGIYKPWYTKIRSVFADDDRDCLYLLLKLYDVSRSISCNHTVFVRTYGRYGRGLYESCIFHAECMESMGNRSNRFNTDYFHCYVAMPYKENKRYFIRNGGIGMNVLQLGIRFVVRKSVKSMLLLLIMFVSTSFIYAGFACQNASIQIQNEGKQAIGGNFRLEGNEANRKARIEVLSAKIGESANGSLDGYHQGQLPSGEWMVWTDNSFETLTYGDIVKISEVEGVSDFNITTANTVVNPVNFQRIEDKDVDQNSDQLVVSLRGNLQMKYDFDVQNGNTLETFLNDKQITGLSSLINKVNPRQEKSKKVGQICKRLFGSKSWGIA